MTDISYRCSAASRTSPSREGSKGISKPLAMRRMENPRLVPLAWYRSAWEEQEEILGKDPWEYGLTESNRRNLDALVQFSFEQGLTRTKLKVADLFLPISQGRKRGEDNI